MDGIQIIGTDFRESNFHDAEMHKAKILAPYFIGSDLTLKVLEFDSDLIPDFQHLCLYFDVYNFSDIVEKQKTLSNKLLAAGSHEGNQDLLFGPNGEMVRTFCAKLEVQQILSTRLNHIRSKLKDMSLGSNYAAENNKLQKLKSLIDSIYQQSSLNDILGIIQKAIENEKTEKVLSVNTTLSGTIFGFFGYENNTMLELYNCASVIKTYMQEEGNKEEVKPGPGAI